MRRNVIDTYPRETDDFIPLTDVSVAGTLITDPADIEVSITPEPSRPTTWTTALLVDGQVGFHLDGPALGRGVYAIYVRPSDGSFTPVIEVGHIRLT